LITVAVAVIFVFTVFVFLIYTTVSSRRRQVILQELLRLLLSLLFPENVRELTDGGNTDRDGKAFFNIVSNHT
jgi:hypothetical protein